jgi:hypothetical protein
VAGHPDPRELHVSRSYLSCIDLAAVAGDPCIDDTCSSDGWIEGGGMPPVVVG